MALLLSCIRHKFEIKLMNWKMKQITSATEKLETIWMQVFMDFMKL